MQLRGARLDTMRPRPGTLMSLSMMPSCFSPSLWLIRVGFFGHDTDPGTFFPLPPGEGGGEGGLLRCHHPSLTLTLSQRERG